MKHTVVSGIFGFTTAVIAVFNVGFLRERVPLALEDHLDAPIHLNHPLSDEQWHTRCDA